MEKREHTAMSASADPEVRAIFDLMDEAKLIDDFDEFVRARVFPSLREMPREMRRAQEISFMMSMLPKGVNMTREQVAAFIDEYHGR